MGSPRYTRAWPSSGPTSPGCDGQWWASGSQKAGEDPRSDLLGQGWVPIGGFGLRAPIGRRPVIPPLLGPWRGPLFLVRHQGIGRSSRAGWAVAVARRRGPPGRPRKALGPRSS
jgi:hypothetical protein